MTAHLLLALWACAAQPLPRASPATTPEIVATSGASEALGAAPGGRARRFLADVGVASAGTLAVAALKPDIRAALANDARLSNVVRNFAHPIEQLRRGTRRDSDPFWVNGVAHPGLFALEALYLKRRGYGDGRAFVFTQVHSVLWELAVEGAAFEPSGKDLLADAAGAAAALWLLRPLAQRAARRLEEGRGRFWDHALRWLDPVSAVAARRPAVPLTVQPSLGEAGLGLRVGVAF
jgi:hypothetical protein